MHDQMKFIMTRDTSVALCEIFRWRQAKGVNGNQALRMLDILKIIKFYVFGGALN